MRRHFDSLVTRIGELLHPTNSNQNEFEFDGATILRAVQAVDPAPFAGY
jgi:hypothetical protein